MDTVDEFATCLIRARVKIIEDFIVSYYGLTCEAVTEILEDPERGPEVYGIDRSHLGELTKKLEPVNYSDLL